MIRSFIVILSVCGRINIDLMGDLSGSVVIFTISNLVSTLEWQRDNSIIWMMYSGKNFRVKIIVSGLEYKALKGLC